MSVNLVQTGDETPDEEGEAAQSAAEALPAGANTNNTIEHGQAMAGAPSSVDQVAPTTAPQQTPYATESDVGAWTEEKLAGDEAFSPLHTALRRPLGSAACAPGVGIDIDFKEFCLHT